MCSGKQDVITDFTIGQDKIDLSDNCLGGIKFANLIISNSAGDAIISLGNNQTIRLIGVNNTALTANDFITNDAITYVPPAQDNVITGMTSK